MTPNASFGRRAATAALLWLAAHPACAQPFPVKPVRVIAPFAAGGGADTVARLVAQKMADALGQQVIVDNRPGASNIIGTELAARAAPDGHTIMIANTVHTINAELFRKLPYDPINDFAPISLIATTPFMLIVHPLLPAKSVRELVALAKSRPGQINYASPGAGTAAHLAAEMLLAPRAVPAPIIARLNEAIGKSLQQNDLRAKLAAEAAEPAGGTPEQFGALLRQEVKKFSELVQRIKLRLD